MADKFFDDYLTGLNTGVALNGASALGAQHAYKPSPPPSIVPPPRPASAPHYGAAPLPRAHTAAAPAPAPRPTRPPTFLDRWVWQLSATLTSRFDRVADRMRETKTWRAVWLLTGALGAVAALNLGLGGPTAHWSLDAAIATGGASLGVVAPFILLGLVRGVLWLMGVAVQLSAALVVTAAFAGAVAAVIYAIVLALA